MAAQITQVIPLYSGNVPSRASPATFSDDGDAWLAYQAPQAGIINTFSAQANALSVYVDGRAVDADNSAVSSQASAVSSAASAALSSGSANYKGLWSAATGAASKPASYGHKGTVWLLNNNLANIALSEPSHSNADWAFVSGVRWIDLITADTAVPANSQNNVQAIGVDVDIALPAFNVNDFLVLHCTANSDSLCRILNPIYTMRGAIGNIAAGDDLTLRAGDTVHLVYVAANILEIV